MFKNILIPISSEYYSKEALKKGANLAKHFESKVNIIYIIEEKTLNQTDKKSNIFRTQVEKKETKEIIIKSQMQTANIIIFFDANNIFKDKGIIPNFKILEGEFSNIIKNEMESNDYDLVLMGYEKWCLLKYRILDDINIPLWIIGTPGDKTLLAICSNLTPNEKIIQTSAELSKLFNWDLQLIYIIDTRDNLLFDENTKRFVRMSIKDLIEKGQTLVEDMKKDGIDAKMVKGGFDEETVQAAKSINANLIVIGQERKKTDLLGFTIKGANRKIVEKCGCSILFMN
jgi:nucleotide-binding universal stress UspA family protein